MFDEQVVAFVVVAAVLVLTPGADMALVMKNALAHGRSAAVSTALGINLGVLIWTAAAAVGVAALLRASGTAFTVLKRAGAAYLIYLGVQTIRHAGKSRLPVVAGRGGDRGLSSPRAFRQGVFSNLLNPKLAVFYTSLLPQFISPGDPVLLKSLLLGAILNAMGLVWLTSYAWLVGKLAAVLRRSSVRRWLDRATGAILIALGLRVATVKS